MNEKDEQFKAAFHVAMSSASPLACGHPSEDGDPCDLQGRTGPTHGGLHAGVRHGTRIFWDEDGTFMDYSQRAIERALNPSPSAASETAGETK